MAPSTDRRRLVVTADDFGLTEGVTRGIVDAMTRGIVTSTSAMMAVPGATDRILRHLDGVAGRVGLHLQLTGGRPCAPADAVPTLVDRDGAFARTRPPAGTWHPDDVAREWQAQLDRLLALGVEPDHLDSHHHVHHRPEALPAFITLANRRSTPCRGGPSAVVSALRAAGLACPDRLDTGWRDLTVEGLLGQVRRSFAAIGGSGVVELMCHPGRVDAALAARSTYVEERARELDVLCDPRVGAGLADLEVRLVRWADLAVAR